ncbi:hypothetical protein [Flavobacterium sp. '19STA2R22 D10 B1']|uniref:hypothetical protein n=1 Tax=Flavobacterium aerium TaxID=3037261 RepID=UPI00278BBDA9|nr:hypothetical protein [Flavobacterium sp. '19STA2R22 D10 B1']
MIQLLPLFAIKFLFFSLLFTEPSSEKMISNKDISIMTNEVVQNNDIMSVAKKYIAKDFSNAAAIQYLDNDLVSEVDANYPYMSRFTTKDEFKNIKDVTSKKWVAYIDVDGPNKSGETKRYSYSVLVRENGDALKSKRGQYEVIGVKVLER